MSEPASYTVVITDLTIDEETETTGLTLRKAQALIHMIDMMDATGEKLCELFDHAGNKLDC